MRRSILALVLLTGFVWVGPAHAFNLTKMAQKKFDRLAQKVGYAPGAAMPSGLVRPTPFRVAFPQTASIRRSESEQAMRRNRLRPITNLRPPSSYAQRIVAYQPKQASRFVRPGRSIFDRTAQGRVPLLSLIGTSQRPINSQLSATREQFLRNARPMPINMAARAVFRAGPQMGGGNRILGFR